MNNSYLYRSIKNTINQNHAIFMIGMGDNFIKSSYTFVRESTEEDPDYAGCFFNWHDITGLPAIIIYVKDPMYEDTFDKVIALCHEYGHFISFQNNKKACNAAGDNWMAFTNNKRLTANQKKKIIEEESRAWKHARLFLKKYLPLTDPRWKRFENLKRSCLRSYHSTLKTANK